MKRKMMVVAVIALHIISIMIVVLSYYRHGREIGDLLLGVWLATGAAGNILHMLSSNKEVESKQ